MKRFISTVGLDKKEWLMYRKKGITGTDAGAIVGMNPYASAFSVYQDKLSIETTDYDNEAMRQGRDLEEYVAQRFMEETGKKVRKANAIFYNEEHPIMLADFDRLIVGENAGLECKTVSPYLKDKWNDGNIPLHYQMQVQHYLAVSGYSCWYIAALIFGQEFIIRKIERDEELISNLISIEEKWWDEHIINQIPPEPDGSSNYTNVLNSKYLSNKEKTVILTGIRGDLERRKELDELIVKLNTEKETIDQKIKLQMEDAAYAETEGYRISWTSSEQRRLDSKKLKADEPELYEKYCKTIPSRRFMVKAVA